ncbi:MAG: hypothetical protein HPY75_12790 [Actinobacteria bacterium]|nr:hypothetical protein [Actinomycetota bacterium]
MARIAWGMAVLVALLVAMSLISGRLRTSTSAGESLSASGKADATEVVDNGTISESPGAYKGGPDGLDTNGAVTIGKGSEAVEEGEGELEAPSAGESEAAAAGKVDEVELSGSNTDRSETLEKDAASVESAEGKYQASGNDRGENATAGEENGVEPNELDAEAGGAGPEATLRADGVEDGGSEAQKDQTDQTVSNGANAPAESGPTTETIEGGSGYLSLEGEGGEMPDLGASLVKVLISLGVVVILVLAARAFLKRSRSKSAVSDGDTYLEVLGYTRLGNGTGVHEVRVGERVWFIAEGEKELRLLGEFDLSELELSRCLGRDGKHGDFARALDGDLAAGTAEWRGTMPRGWLNALRWKTAR